MAGLLQPPLFMSMPSVNDELTRIDTEENRIGVAGLGRLLFTTHALGNQSEATNVGGGRGLVVGSIQGLQYLLVRWMVPTQRHTP